MTKIILTCEHGGNEIPPEYRRYFRSAATDLKSHRGMDFGALEIYRQLEDCADYAACSTVSRLLADLNRSSHNPRIFSKHTRQLPREIKQEILERHYWPFRNAALDAVRRYIHRNCDVFHLSLHTFTPCLDGKKRKADVGLLYDPQRLQEKKICHYWRDHLRGQLPMMQVRFNYPYRGTADGHTKCLRAQFNRHYAGVELEINQALVDAEDGMLENLTEAIKRMIQWTQGRHS